MEAGSKQGGSKGLPEGRPERTDQGRKEVIYLRDGSQVCLCQISEASAYPGLKIIKNHLAVKPGGKTPAQPQKAYVIIVKRPLCVGEGGNYIHKETPPSCASQYPPHPRVRLEVPALVTVVLAKTVQMKDFKVSLSGTLYIKTQHKMNFPHLITATFFFFKSEVGLVE